MLRYMVVVAGPGCGEIRYTELRAVMVGRELERESIRRSFRIQIAALCKHESKQSTPSCRIAPTRYLFGCYLWSRGGRTLQRVCGIVREAKVRGLYCYASFSFPLCKYGYHPTH